MPLRHLRPHPCGIGHDIVLLRVPLRHLHLEPCGIGYDSHPGDYTQHRPFVCRSRDNIGGVLSSFLRSWPYLVRLRWLARCWQASSGNPRFWTGGDLCFCCWGGVFGSVPKPGARACAEFCSGVGSSRLGGWRKAGASGATPRTAVALLKVPFESVAGGEAFQRMSLLGDRPRPEVRSADLSARNRALGASAWAIFRGSGSEFDVRGPDAIRSQKIGSAAKSGIRKTDRPLSVQALKLGPRSSGRPLSPTYVHMTCRPKRALRRLSIMGLIHDRVEVR